MDPLMPLNNEFQKTIVDMQKRLIALETTKQPYYGDWVSQTPSYFSYSATDKIAVAGLDATTVFQVDDKLKIEQTTTKYLKIAKVESDAIYLANTPDFALANETISALSFSRLENPQGWSDTYFEWTFTAPSFVIYQSDVQVYWSGNWLRIGDKVLITDNSDVEYYFNVYHVGSGYISLTGGDDYIVPATIKTFAYSRQAHPLGFPSKFFYEALVFDSAGNDITADMSYADVTFSMDGNQVILFGEVRAVFSPVKLATIYVSTPFTVTTTLTEGYYLAWDYRFSGLNRADFGNWGAPYGVSIRLASQDSADYSDMGIPFTVVGTL